MEQYDQKAGEVGAWSDLYALGIVPYRCVSGAKGHYYESLLGAVARARLERIGELANDMKHRPRRQVRR